VGAVAVAGVRASGRFLAVSGPLAASEAGLVVYKMAWVGGCNPVVFHRNLYHALYSLIMCVCKLLILK